MTAESIGSLFAKDISRRIEEVIKVDQTDEEIIRDEISEYVVTDSIRSHYQQILDRYWETSTSRTKASGFGYLDSLALESRASRNFSALHSRTEASRAKVLLGFSVSAPATGRFRCCSTASAKRRPRMP